MPYAVVSLRTDANRWHDGAQPSAPIHQPQVLTRGPGVQQKDPKRGCVRPRATQSGAPPLAAASNTPTRRPTRGCGQGSWDQAFPKGLLQSAGAPRLSFSAQ